jgi:hypothetical protein
VCPRMIYPYDLLPTNEAGDELVFHALRHTCRAWLAIGGNQPKVIQSVMRHSTITLTLDTYGHLLAGAETAAVNQNAGLTSIQAMLSATGTDSCLLPVDAHLIPSRARAACDEVRKGASSKCTKASDEKQKSRAIPKENAAPCETVRGSAPKRRARESNPQLLPATDFESAS